MANSSSGYVEVTIDWSVDDEVETNFANNLMIQHTDDNFFVSYYQLIPPPVVGPPQEIAKQLRKLNKVKAKCVARIVLTPEKMKEFLDVMQANYATFMAKRAQKDEEES